MQCAMSESPVEGSTADGGIGQEILCPAATATAKVPLSKAALECPTGDGK